MAEEIQAEGQAPQAKGKGMKMLIIVVVAALVLGGGGLTAFLLLKGGGGKAEVAEEEAAGAHGEKQSALIAFEPFVVNLSAPGRYLKVSIHFELKDGRNKELVEGRMPVLRDAVITLLSSKSTEAVSGPEGKFQLKDEILYRVNQAMEKEVFKNLYFTEFVMQ